MKDYYLSLIYFQESFSLKIHCNTPFFERKREDSCLVFENITITRLNHLKLSRITNLHCENNFKLPETNIFKIALKSQLQKLFYLEIETINSTSGREENFIFIYEKLIPFVVHFTGNNNSDETIEPPWRFLKSNSSI